MSGNELSIEEIVDACKGDLTEEQIDSIEEAKDSATDDGEIIGYICSMLEQNDIDSKEYLKEKGFIL